MDVLTALVLALIEGLTEFLPVSSTGHLIIVSSLYGIEQQAFVKHFNVIIQLPAILAVVVLYYKRLLASWRIYWLLALGFLPAAVLGFLLKDYIDQLLESVELVAVMLILGGIVLLFVDRWFAGNELKPKELTPKSALFVGLMQALAMVPGTSRSGSTIVGGLLAGLNRKEAAEFSFLLAVPTMLAASLYKLYKAYSDGSLAVEGQTTVLIVGCVVSFVVALLAIKGFIGFLTRYGFKAFGWYRIGLGALILFLIYGLGLELQLVD